LSSCRGSSFVSPEFGLCSFTDGVETFCLTLRRQQFSSILSRLCWAIVLALGERDFVLSSDLVLAFVCLLITCLSFWFVSFLFLFSLNCLLCLLSMHSSRRRLRTVASKDQWMVAPWCNEWLTTLCGLILGRCRLWLDLR
jgi:hypothetical protein